jgi:hypothetical protein
MESKRLSFSGEAIEPVALSVFAEVDAGFFQGVTGRAKLDIRQTPKLEETGVGAIGGGEEDVGIQEEPVHG